MALILKHDATADIDPTWLLERGQPGVELRSGTDSSGKPFPARMKIGDGVTAWKQLNYISPDPKVYQDTRIDFATSSLTFATISSPAKLRIEAKNTLNVSSGSINFFGAAESASDTSQAICMIADGSVSTNASNPASLGLSIRPWSVVYAQTGTIQTSSRDSKDSIRYLGEMDRQQGKPTHLNTESILEFIRNLEPATFCYKHGDHAECDESNSNGCQIQLGLIADDIKNDPVYKYIGVSDVDETGKEQLGLQVLPLTVAALTACKYLLAENEHLKESIKDIQSQLA